MDAIHLSGYVWIKCLYAKVRWVYDRKMWACGREELALVWLCMHACMCIWYVFNCGFKLLSGRLIRKYMYGYTYMEVFTITFCIFIMGLGLKWNFYAGTLTTKRVARLVTLIMRERMYATVSTVRNKFFLSLWGRMARACIMLNYHSHNYIVPPLIKFLLGYVTLIHYGIVSLKGTC